MYKFLTPVKTGRSMSPDWNTVKRRRKRLPTKNNNKKPSTLHSNDNHPTPCPPILSTIRYTSPYTNGFNNGTTKKQILSLRSKRTLKLILPKASKCNVMDINKAYTETKFKNVLGADQHGISHVERMRKRQNQITSHLVPQSEKALKHVRRKCTFAQAVNNDVKLYSNKFVLW